MNAYYTNTNSQKRIRNYSLPRINVKDGFIEFICSLVAFFTCEAVIKILKVCISFVCFVGFFGVAGGMEGGSISMICGFICCGAFTLIEAAILKGMVKPSATPNDENQ